MATCLSASYIGFPESKEHLGFSYKIQINFPHIWKKMLMIVVWAFDSHLVDEQRPHCPSYQAINMWIVYVVLRRSEYEEIFGIMPCKVCLTSLSFFQLFVWQASWITIYIKRGLSLQADYS